MAAAVHQSPPSDSFEFLGGDSVEFPPTLLDEIRDAVLEGFIACPEGGVEVLGVLWGSRGSHRPRAQKICSVTAELSQRRFGPAEIFSHLSRLVEEAERDAQFGPAEVLGWFRSSAEPEIVVTDATLHKQIADFAFPFLVGCFLKFRPVQLSHIRAWTAHSDRNGKFDLRSFQPFLVSAAKSGPLRASIEPDPPTVRHIERIEPAKSLSSTSPSTPIADPARSGRTVGFQMPQLRFIHWAFVVVFLVMIVMGLRLSHNIQQAQALAIRNADLLGQVSRVETRNRRLESLVATMRDQCRSSGKKR